MSKIEIKGVVRTIGRVITRTSATKQTLVQSIIVVRPGYTDDFGDKKSDDQPFEFQLFNDSINKHKLLERNLQGKKVVVTGYLNSRAYQSNGEERYALQINIHSIEEWKA